MAKPRTSKAVSPADAESLPQRRNRSATVGVDAAINGENAFRRAGFHDPVLILRWEEIAGPEVARIARPLRLSVGKGGGVLTLKAEPGAALFLQHESRALCGRINAYLGRQAVGRLKFVQGSLAPPPAQPPRPRKPGPIPPDDPALTYQGPQALREALIRVARLRHRAD